jgi:hypothetical protein
MTFRPLTLSAFPALYSAPPAMLARVISVSPSYFGSSSTVRVKATSSAVSGEPSLKVRFGRSLMVYTLLSALTCQLSARPGTRLPWLSQSIRREKMTLVTFSSQPLTKK